MPKKLQRSVQSCISKNRILSACKHPKTLSFAIDCTTNNDNKSQPHEEINNNKNDNVHDEAATLSDIDRFLFENFKSLYINDDHNSEERKDCNNKGGCDGKDISIFESPRLFELPRKNLRGSNRFFVEASPSSSIIEEARSSLTTNATTMTTSDDVDVGPFSVSSSSSLSSLSGNNTKLHSINNNINDNDIIIDDVALPEDCIAVMTYSPSPYDDFRRSMQEMLEARMQKHGKVDWDFMEELLICYLEVNEKVSHKFILSAFADLVVGLRGSPNRVPGRSRQKYSPRGGRENRRLRRREGI